MGWTHNGLSMYTIGQGARLSGANEKWYVVSKDPQLNTITICRGTSHPSLFTNWLECRLETFNWLQGVSPLRATHLDCKATVRYRQKRQRCRVRLDWERGVMRVYFDLPQRGVAPEQTLALYDTDGDACLGGGPILGAGPNLCHMDDYNYDYDSDNKSLLSLVSNQ